MVFDRNEKQLYVKSEKMTNSHRQPTRVRRGETEWIVRVKIRRDKKKSKP